MMTMQVIPYPIVCPTCNDKVCLQDIKEIATATVHEKISERAVAELVLKFPDKYRPCFKTGCPQ